MYIARRSSALLYAIFALAAYFSVSPAQASIREALVIGNSAYRNVPRNSTRRHPPIKLKGCQIFNSYNVSVNVAMSWAVYRPLADVRIVLLSCARQSVYIVT